MFKLLADNIHKPIVDDRCYRLIKLGNGLKALLIHDPTADKSAAGLDVFAGASNDKTYQVPGLAHFCEHLLFMGTKKYPKENEYSAYLSDHGGHSNAFTSFEHTNYYFEVNSDYLEGALDRFAQFFIDPLFSESCKDREIKAVDSENKKNLQDDYRRFSQLEKSTVNPSHPFNHFSTGNITTLGTEPLAKGWNVRDILIKYYNDCYSANTMRLVVLGKESLDDLTTLVTEKFSDITNKDLPPKPQYDDIIFTKNELKKQLTAKSVMDMNKLEFTFMIPNDQDDNWEYLPAAYYSHLIGHESKGSIYYYLNELGLVNSLSCGSYKVCSGSSLFVIECELTEVGLKNYQQVAVHVFEYLKMLKHSGPQEWIFNEIKQMNEINFKFRQKENAAKTVSRLSNSLYKFDIIPPELIFNYNTKIKFKPDLINEYGDYLDVDNCRFLLSSKSFEGLKLKEKWYGTEYEYTDLDEDLVDTIKSCSSNDNFHLPMKNKFIPENFQIYNKTKEAPLKKPFLFKDNTKLQVWFKQDDQFKVPKVVLHLLIHLPNSNTGIESSIKTQLYCELLDNELNDLSYYASMVGLTFRIYQWRDGILIKLSGYNDKLFVLLQEILDKIFAFKPKASKFELIKNKLLQDFRNFGYEVPYLQINTNFLKMLNDKTYLLADEIPVLESITFEDSTAFIDKLFETVFVESLLVGNINVDQVGRYTDMLSKSFEPFKSIADNFEDIEKVIKLQSFVSEETVVANLDLQDPDNVNSSIEYFIKLGSPVNYESRSLIDLISIIFHEPCFNQLRTKEQLGYVVFSGIRLARNYMGYRILVQSERSASYLRSRIENFLQLMSTKLKDLTEEEFENYKKTLIDKKLTKLKNLNEESGRFWNAITDGYIDFTIHEKLVEHIKEITKDQLIEFYNQFIGPDSKNPRYILNLHSQKVKFIALKNILKEEGIEVDDDLISKNQDDLEALVGKDKLFVVENKFKELFPQYDDKQIEFGDFKKNEKAGIPRYVEPLSNFYFTELHL